MINNMPEFSKNAPLVSGLEWEDPMHTNRLSVSEERRLSILITKIASLVNMRKLILRPYFQDYELHFEDQPLNIVRQLWWHQADRERLARPIWRRKLGTAGLAIFLEVSKNNGTVTIAHFARILAYLNILISADDFNLLVKKYIKDSYTINYIAFLAAIDEVVDYLNRNGIMDLSGDIMSLFPGRILNAELPKLPRPEIGKILASHLFGKQNIFHPALKEPNKLEPVLTTLSLIRDHVYKNRLRVCQFFKDFDPFNCGRITAANFHRGLDALVLSGMQRLFLSLPDVEGIVAQYQDPCDPTRVCWKTFEDDIDQVFTVKVGQYYI
ncbi:hypothetical protein NQ318_014804 [Aromia moschata]|uniref:EF-hand domain-containing protein n=1 Tax=Aromia moschata TaxID=1265417 RepID=A0AAV8ZCB6_9CUCU|nr:hypothetical protein NQ318_014804 [Aromia moschata]